MFEIVSRTILTYAGVPVLIAASYALYLYRGLEGVLKIFATFIIVSGILELISKILWINSMNNIPALHFYAVAGFVCLTWFYCEVLSGFINRRILWVIAFLFVIYYLVDSLIFRSFLEFNSKALVVESILIIVYSLFTFMTFMNDIVRQERINLIKSLTWINSGVFIYYTSSLLIFYFTDFLNTHFSPMVNRTLWCVHALFLLIMNLCFFIGLWKRPKN